MPLHVGHVDASVDIQASPTEPAAPRARAQDEQALLRQLRPIVLRILEEELARLRRAAG